MEEETLQEVLHDPEAIAASKHTFVSGIISAASDVDPTTVATLAIAGASIQYGLEWLVALIVPMFTIVQMLGTQVATVSREGLQSAVRRRYGTTIALISLACILAVNVITYAADLEAGAAALALITHVHYVWFLIPLSIVITVLLMFGTMDDVMRWLVVLPLAFLAYVATTFIAHPNWHAVAAGFVPRFESSSLYISTIVALIGTALTTYSYYWQTVEIASNQPPKRAVWALQLASIPGTVVTGAVLWFILVGTAATLGIAHTTIQTAQDAAKALEPIAGAWASIIFGIGLFGSAILALPVLAAGMASATSSTLRWGGSLDKRPHEAKRYYGTMAIGVALSTLLALAGIAPIKLLFIASIAGGIGTPVTLALLVLLARDTQTMGDNIAPKGLAAAGWGVVGVITAASLAFIRWH
ncbi:MAG TPA: divalent metal cation transporter [Candidatus Aquilonibacter sp.]|nr:divalent metal cation transporter [Candidatus Aquilonibacter sp.]